MAACASSQTAARFDVVEIEVGDVRLDVWLADESGERIQGLSEIEGLPQGIDGMLFVFPVTASTSFNMEDMFFPLDIWWFDPEMTLIGRTRMEPCTGFPCTSYGSPGEIGWALETPAEEHDFKNGDRLSIVEND